MDDQLPFLGLDRHGLRLGRRHIEWFAIIFIGPALFLSSWPENGIALALLLTSMWFGLVEILIASAILHASYPWNVVWLAILVALAVASHEYQLHRRQRVVVRPACEGHLEDPASYEDLRIRTYGEIQVRPDDGLCPKGIPCRDAETCLLRDF